jgi:hypothetical protein
MSFNKTFQIVVCTVFMLSCKSDGIASEGPGIHLRPPTSYYGLMNPSATAVVGSIRAIEGQPRTTLSSETSNVGGQSVRAAYDYYRGEIVDPQVVMAKQNCPQRSGLPVDIPECAAIPKIRRRRWSADPKRTTAAVGRSRAPSGADTCSGREGGLLRRLSDEDVLPSNRLPQSPGLEVAPARR